MTIPTIKTKNAGIIILDSFGDKKIGLLSVAQSVQKNALVLPIHGSNDAFMAERFFVISDISEPDAVRANHAHRKTSEVIVCVQGSCVVHLDDGSVQQDIVLDHPSVGIITGPDLWHRIDTFAPNTVLLALADGPYDPEEYIHSHEEFLLAVGK